MKKLWLVLMFLIMPIIMGFGDSAILDDFNRGNEGPPPSASWTSIWLTFDGIQVDTNQCRASAAGFKGAYWNVTTFGSNSEVYMTVSTLPADSEYVFMGLRIAQPGAATVDGYNIHIQRDDTGGDIILVRRMDNGAQTLLGATISHVFTTGDKFGFNMIGSTIRVYKDTGSGWTHLGTRTDSAYSVAGFIGIGAENTTSRLDDFGGGTVGGTQVVQLK